MFIGLKDLEIATKEFIVYCYWLVVNFLGIKKT